MVFDVVIHVTEANETVQAHQASRKCPILVIDLLSLTDVPLHPNGLFKIILHRPCCSDGHTATLRLWIYSIVDT